MVTDGQIVRENVRRYRAIASLCRQTAALRPLQKWSLLDQAEGWERLAREEAYLVLCESLESDHRHTGGGAIGADGCCLIYSSSLIGLATRHEQRAWDLKRFKMLDVGADSGARELGRSPPALVPMMIW